MKFTTSSLAALLCALAASAASAHGDVKCDANTNKAEWQPQMTLQAKLVNEGWKVRKVQVYNGCYEVYGFDPKGAKAEAFFDPKTFERVMPDDENPAKK
ncbi:MAG: PepSY domain-containing protein [Cytophagales bacterium]|nr:PepSY domain-containing protein [Rhizobacter sp.]